MSAPQALALTTSVLAVFTLVELLLEDGRSRSRGYLFGILVLILTSRLWFP